MKKIIIALIALISITSSLHAQQASMPLISATSFKTIRISNDMDVVLINASTPQSDVKFNASISENLDISIERGTLVISNRSFIKKATVYLMVDGLEKLVVGPNSSIVTHGVLNSKNLQVFVSQGAKAHIKLLGKVRAFPTDESEISVTRLVEEGTIKASF